MAGTDPVFRQTERWFVRQGVPTFIDPYRFSVNVLPRMLPFLAGVVAATVVSVVVLAFSSGLQNALIGGLSWLVAQIGLPLVLVRSGLPRLSGRVASGVLVAYALVPILLPSVFVAIYGTSRGAQLIGRTDATVEEIVGVVTIVLVVAYAAIFALAWAVTAYGLVPLARRAIGHVISDMRGSLQLQGRAMPTLLFVTFFLFFTGELWQLMNHLGWGRLVAVLALFAAVTVLATSARLRSEIDRVEQDLAPQRVAAACAGTPLADLTADAPPAQPPPLTARQETNVLMVLATRQLIQAAVVGLGLFAFFVILGVIIVDDVTAASWIGAAPQHSVWAPFLPVALLRAAALLAGFGSMYFAITTMTQREYRQEFFEPVISDVERTLAVRAVYLDARAHGEGHFPGTSPNST